MHVSNKSKLLIVEDDPFIAQDIADICRNQGYDVEAVYHTPEEALSHETAFDLALLDINLESGISGIELATRLKAKFACGHLFITSYFDKLTIELAGSTEPLAYITKPYSENGLISNLHLALSKAQRNRDKLFEQPEHIFVKSAKSLVKILPGEVSYIQAFDIYAKVFVNDERIVVSQGLKHLQPIFEPYGFLRIHKSYMVNLSEIGLIQDDEVYIGEQRIPVGRAYKQELLKSIQVI